MRLYGVPLKGILALSQEPVTKQRTLAGHGGIGALGGLGSGFWCSVNSKLVCPTFLHSMLHTVRALTALTNPVIQLG